MMRRTFYTPDGPVERDLTANEISWFAARGDRECMVEIAREEWAAATTVADKIAVIAKLLGLAP